MALNILHLRKKKLLKALHVNKATRDFGCPDVIYLEHSIAPDLYLLFSDQLTYFPYYRSHSKMAKVSGDSERSSQRPITARSITTVISTSTDRVRSDTQHTVLAYADQEDELQPPDITNPIATTKSNKIILPPLVIPTNSAENPKEQVDIRQAELLPTEGGTGGSRPTTPDVRPGPAVSKQTQEHSKDSAAQVYSTGQGQTPLGMFYSVQSSAKVFTKVNEM